MTGLKVISTVEVKKHRNKENGVWIIIHNDVYDVTSFLEEHPGGEESLMDVAGQEATQDFEDVGHSDDARELMKKYVIGTLPPEEKKKAQDHKTGGTLRPDDKFNVPPWSNLKWAVVALAGALVVGIVLKKYLSK